MFNQSKIWNYDLNEAVWHQQSGKMESFMRIPRFENEWWKLWGRGRKLVQFSFFWDYSFRPDHVLYRKNLEIRINNCQFLFKCSVQTINYLLISLGWDASWMFWKDFQKIGQIFDNVMEAGKYGGEWESSINFVPSEQLLRFLR